MSMGMEAGDRGGGGAEPGRTAMRRLEALGELVDRPAADALATIEGWCEQEGLVVRRAVGGGAEHLLVEVPAAQPAFGSHQRQALWITARWEPGGDAEAAPAARAAACGGVLIVEALAAAAALAARQARGDVAAARDLLVSFEVPQDGDAGEGSGRSGADRPLHALLARTQFAIAEPGGWPLMRARGGRLEVVAVGVAQKGRVELRLHTRGRAPDAALPGGDAAATRLLEALDRLRAMPRPWTVTSSARAFVRQMASAFGPGRGLALRALLASGGSRGLLERLPEVDTELVEAMFRESFAITSLRASGDRAEAVVDWRTLPGHDHRAVVQELRRALPSGTGIELLRWRPPAQAPEHTSLWRILEPAVAAASEGARVVAMPIPGSCDALGWRQQAVPCYGFAPIRVAGADLLRARAAGAVKVAETGLRWGASLLVEVVSRFCVEG